MHELHTAVFYPLLGHGCDLCGWGVGSPQCSNPFALSDRGQPTRIEDPSHVVSWPRCPHSYAALREFGQDLVPLDSIIAWSYEQGVHTDETLGAGGQRLIREWVRIKETPSVLKMRRDEDERARKNR